MNKDEQEILVAGGALLLPFLFKKDKNKQNNKGFNDLSRFDNYPNSNGEFAGGYYDRVTQELLTEQSKKDSPTYFGDKSKNALYDPFYDYTGSPVQAETVKATDLTPTDYDSAAKCVRVRIVPNSLFVGSDVARAANGTIREEHIYCCVVEIFNPFPFMGYDSTKYKIDINGIGWPSVDGEAPSMIVPVMVQGYSGNNRIQSVVRYSTYHPYGSQDPGVFTTRLAGGGALGVWKWFKQMADREGVFAELPESVPGQTSIYLPCLLSYLPDPNGDIFRNQTPLYMRDDLKYYKLSPDKEEIVGEVPTACEGLSLALNVKVNGIIRQHVCAVTTGKDSYTFAADKSTCGSHCDKEFFRLNSTPIYQRQEFWTAVMGQRTLDLSTITGGRASRSYWWCRRMFNDFERFAPFGTINL